jgi:hypothetical protein
MSGFLLLSLCALAVMAFIGWRVGWLTQVLWYALFGLFVSGSLLLSQELALIYERSGVPEHVAGLTALITILIFSGLLVVPSLRLHRVFYTRREIDERFRQPGGAGLALLVCVLLLYAFGKSLMRYDIIGPESDAYYSIEMRLIRAIDGSDAQVNN